MQRRLLKLLDKWIAMTDEEIVQDCRKISKLESAFVEESTLRFEKVEHKVIKKLASRLASPDRFDLEGDMSVCANLYREKFDSYLTFSALELQTKVTRVV